MTVNLNSPETALVVFGLAGYTAIVCELARQRGFRQALRHFQSTLSIGSTQTVPRTPLTDDQLAAAFNAADSTYVCPRCGDDEDLSRDDLETHDDDCGVRYKVTCNGCNEEFIVDCQPVALSRKDD